ncbi:MAG TPA: cysteine--tRNA ligase [Lacipirellulaceae bacterium]|nr:cysteine--tRNA ligase [Lacipirellulaceae bacterium]
MSTSTTAIDEAMTLSEPHPSITVYSSLTKRKDPFRTVEPGRVGIYLCGPTVYDKAHIGHMVGPVIFDAIKRYLTYCGYKVTWVVNITDVDDKLIAKASERGISMLAVAEENILDYHGNLHALGVDQIDHFPRATECMPEIIGIIERLIERGFAYESGGDVYFDVARDADYGKLSNRTLDAVQGDGGGGADRKRHAADFALWKSAKPGEPSWESPWSKGRPGWHIECSAMSKKLLGETFDIHGGGLDLVFPHHENEIAQSECCHGKPLATYWTHNGLLRRDASAGKIGGRAERDQKAGDGIAGPDDAVSGKMSRSKGAGGLADLIKRQGGERIRFFLLRTHYRSTVLFSEEAIAEAAIGLESFYRLFKRYQRITASDFYALQPPAHRAPHEAGDGIAGPSSANPALIAAAACKAKFLAAMDDDFNTGGAMAELFELAKIANRYCEEHNLETTGADNQTIGTLTLLASTLKELASILGLFLMPPALPVDGTNNALLGKVMELVIDLRTDARKAKNFAIADAIRDGLAPTGVKLEDRAGGTEWTGGGEGSLDGVVAMLIALRQTARANKDFATADAIRDRLAEAGIKLEDRPGGVEWSRA